MKNANLINEPIKICMNSNNRKLTHRLNIL